MPSPRDAFSFAIAPVVSWSNNFLSRTSCVFLARTETMSRRYARTTSSRCRSAMRDRFACTLVVGAAPAKFWSM